MGLTAEPAGNRRLAMFLDGTWNTNDDNTNVWRIKSLAERSGGQVCFYSAGVGTEKGEQVLGGMLGFGLTDEVVKAYKWLMENYVDGDDVYIFGFSRGAFTARSLSGFVSKCGLLTPGAPISVSQMYRRYQRGAQAMTIRELQALSNPPPFLEGKWLLKYSRAIDIHFLGVWDTVGALGIPFGNIPLVSRSEYQFLETDLRINNKHAFHALAIDEHRGAFAPTLWTRTEDRIPNPNYKQRSLDEVEQRWFVGAHANVGGGYANDVLSQLPLKWIMDKAAACGLRFSRQIEIDGDERDFPIEDSYAKFAFGVYRALKFGHRFYRPIGESTKNLPNGGTITPINETIDSSVFERWRVVQGYRPENLRRWGVRYGVDPATKFTSIRADHPSEVVR